MDEKLSIKVNIADRYYPLKIERKVLQYKQRYLDKDTQDFLAMAALQFVSKVLELEERFDAGPIEQQVKELSKELEDYLSGE
jgi:hypothetical protein